MNMRLNQIIENMYNFNDDDLSRPLVESIVVPEITKAIGDWIGSASLPGVLIGGLALSFYAKPRSTMDIDVLYITDRDIPDDIPGFKKVRSHSFQHNSTHVEVEVLSATFLGIPEGLVKKVVETSVESNNMKIASKSGLIALKLFRGKRQDLADIEQLIETGGIDLSPFVPWLSKEQLDVFQEIKTEYE